MAYTTAEGRQQILQMLAAAADEIGTALAQLSEAYEHLDDPTAERLEETLFGPVQAAYGRAKKVHADFAARTGLSGASFQTPSQPVPSTPAKALIERAIDAVIKADTALAELQDSMLPIEVGDAELRASLSQTRELLARVPAPGRELVRMLGR